MFAKSPMLLYRWEAESSSAWLLEAPLTRPTRLPSRRPRTTAGVKRRRTLRLQQILDAGKSLVWKGLLAVCVLIIVGISAIDAYLNVRFPVRDSNEENPIARWILTVSQNDVSLLISIKLLGTALVPGILCAYYSLYWKRALVVAGVVASFQCYVLSYLLLARANDTFVSFLVPSLFS